MVCFAVSSIRDWGLAVNSALRVSLAIAYRLAHKRICVSLGAADDTAKLLGISSDPFTVTYNPLSVSAIDSPNDADVVEADWNGCRGPRILTVGRLKKVNNHKLLVQAFKRVQAIRRDERRMIPGTGPLFEEIQEYILSLGLDGFVFMPGHSTNHSPYYRLAICSSGTSSSKRSHMACQSSPRIAPAGPAEILRESHVRGSSKAALSEASRYEYSRRQIHQTLFYWFM